MDIGRVLVTTFFCYLLLHIPLFLALPFIKLIEYLATLGIVFPKLINLVLFSPFLVWYIASPFIAYKAAIYNVGHNHDIWDSIVFAVNDFRLYLALLPIIGGLFYKEPVDEATRFKPTEQVSRFGASNEDSKSNSKH